MTSFDFGNQVGAAILNEQVLIVWDHNSFDMISFQEAFPGAPGHFYDVKVFRDWVFVATGENLLHMWRFRRPEPTYALNMVQQASHVVTTQGVAPMDNSTRMRVQHAIQSPLRRLEYQAPFALPDHMIAGKEANVSTWPIFGVEIFANGTKMLLTHPHFVSEINLNQFLTRNIEASDWEEILSSWLPRYVRGIEIPYAIKASVNEAEGLALILVRDFLEGQSPVRSLRIVRMDQTDPKTMPYEQVGTYVPLSPDQEIIWTSGRYLERYDRYFFIRKDRKIGGIRTEELLDDAEVLSRFVVGSAAPGLGVTSFIRGLSSGSFTPASYFMVDRYYYHGRISTKDRNEFAASARSAEYAGLAVSWAAVLATLNPAAIASRATASGGVRLAAKRALINFIKQPRDLRRIGWYMQVGGISATIAEASRGIYLHYHEKNKGDGKKVFERINYTNIGTNVATAGILGLIITTNKISSMRRALLAAMAVSFSSYGTMSLVNPEQNKYETVGYGMLGLATPFFMNIQWKVGEWFTARRIPSHVGGVAYSFGMALAMAYVFYPMIQEVGEVVRDGVDRVKPGSDEVPRYVNLDYNNPEETIETLHDLLKDPEIGGSEFFQPPFLRAGPAPLAGGD